MRAYHGDGLPISPLGYCGSRDELLVDLHGIPSPPDYASRHEIYMYNLAGQRSAAWVEHACSFCCVGVVNLSDMAGVNRITWKL